MKANPLAADSDLIVYADGPRGSSDVEGVEAVRSFVRRVSGFRDVRIIERPGNVGLAVNAIDGITDTCDRYGSAIYLEDDNVTSPYFLQYINDGLELYRDDDRVASINGYIPAVAGPLPETFFLRGAETWGWGTWSRAWKLFRPDAMDLLRELKRRHLIKLFDYNYSVNFSGMLLAQANGLIDSHTIRWYASTLLADLMTLYPNRSLVRNIGNDGSGVHSNTSSTDVYDVELADSPIRVGRIAIEDCPLARKAMEEFNRKNGFGISPFRRFVRDAVPNELLMLYQTRRRKRVALHAGARRG